jgi:hypothetical protein
MDEYEYKGCFDGYEVYVCYAQEGPDWEEAWAVFWEAANSILYQNLAGLGEELKH